MILNGISFLYRLTVFWTAAIVAVRHSNPSFKVMVRPGDSFQGPVRLFLYTALPALFITAVPSEIFWQTKAAGWLVLSAVVCVVVWTTVALMWRAGVRRYSVEAS